MKLPENMVPRSRKGSLAWYWIPSGNLAKTFTLLKLNTERERAELLPHDPEQLKRLAIARAILQNEKVEAWRRGESIEGAAGVKYNPAHIRGRTVAAGIYKFREDNKKRKEKLSDHTVRGYETHLRKLETLFGNVDAEDVALEHITEAQDEMREGGFDGAADKLGVTWRIVANHLRSKHGWKMADFSGVYIKGSDPAGLPWPDLAITEYRAAARRLGHSSAAAIVHYGSICAQRMEDTFEIPAPRYNRRTGILTLDPQSKTGASVPPLELREYYPELAADLEEELARTAKAEILDRLFMTNEACVPYNYDNWRRIHRHILFHMIADKLTRAGWYKSPEKGVAVMPEISTDEKRRRSFRWWHDSLAASFQKRNPKGDLAALMLMAARQAASFETDYILKNAKAIESYRIFIGDLQFRYLRHTGVCAMSEATLSDREIAAITGHKGQQITAILDRYHKASKTMANNALRKRRDYELRKKAEAAAEAGKAKES